MESRVSKSPSSSPPPAAHDGGDGDAAARVTRRLYLHRPGPPGTGALEKDAVLRRIRHRRRANSLRDTLRSLLVVQQQQRQAAAPETEPKDGDGDGEGPAWLGDAFSAP